MKLSWWTAPVCLLAGILIGKMTVQPASDDGAGRPLEKPSARSRDDRASGRMLAEGPELARIRKEIRSAPADRMPGLLKRALQHPDPFERRLLVMECFEGMNGTNWLEMYQQFTDVTKESGIIHPTDQRMSLMVVGRNGGQQAAEWFRDHAGPDQLREVVWGWGQREPQAAVAWLNSGNVADPAQRRRLLSVAIGGAAHSDGISAMAMLEGLDPEDRQACTGDFLWNLSQRDGVGAAVEWSAQTKQRLAGSDPDFAGKVSDMVVGHILETRKDVGGAREAAGWMASIIESDAAQAAKLPRVVSRLPEEQRLDFLSSLASSKVASSSEVKGHLESQLETLVHAQPDKAAQWMDAHPNDSLAGKIKHMLD